MKERIVCVEWEDASFASGYYDRKSPKDFEPVLTRSVGHFIKKTKSGIIIGMERFYDDKRKPTDDRHITTIPKKMIRRIIELVDREGGTNETRAVKEHSASGSDAGI